MRDSEATGHLDNPILTSTIRIKLSKHGQCHLRRQMSRAGLMLELPVSDLIQEAPSLLAKVSLGPIWLYAIGCNICDSRFRKTSNGSRAFEVHEVTQGKMYSCYYGLARAYVDVLPWPYTSRTVQQCLY